jgi:pimeloyl-ACP methyl ester carboxylesterase
MGGCAVSVTEREVVVDGVRLAIAEAGEGGRPFLLVHGFTGAKEDFTDFLERLAEAGWHAVAPDNRGHGSSDAPAGIESYSLDRFATDVLGLADQLWPGRPFVLLGHSMGGMIAQVLAVREPGRLAGLVLMDTGHGRLHIPADQLEKIDAIVQEIGTAGLADIQARQTEPGPLDSPAHLKLMAERAGYREFNDRKLRAASPDMYRAMIKVICGADDRLDSLAAIRVPTLVVVGEQDAPFIKASENMAKTIPGAELAVLPDAGHSPQFENERAWWDAVSGFLAGLAPNGARA